MNITPYYESAIRKYSNSDKKFFDKATGFLPERKETTPYHSGPHSVRSLRMAYQLAGRPSNVLETGFCLGHSSALWFALGAEKVISVDNSDRPETQHAIIAMLNRFNGGDFTFVHREFATKDVLEVMRPTFMFIDGDHSVEGVDEDVRLALDLGISSILFDDYFPHWGPGIQPAIEKYGLIPLAILGTMCLCVPEL